MTENTKLWDILGRTDPAHTKAFTRGGGFKGTAIKPMWSYRRMTEEFGPCGLGWGVGEPVFQVVPAVEGEMLVYCTASIWYGEAKSTVYGVGGDKVVGKNKYGLSSDDEAFKKAFTDAVTNALKLIGVGADVHMGMFDDSKYVNTMREEFADAPAVASGPSHLKANGKPEKGWRSNGTRTSYWLKTNGLWGDLKAMLDDDMLDCKSLVQLEQIKTIYRDMARAQQWNKEFLDALTLEFNAHERTILNQLDAEELAEIPLKDALSKSLAQHPLNAG